MEIISQYISIYLYKNRKYQEPPHQYRGGVQSGGVDEVWQAVMYQASQADVDFPNTLQSSFL